MKRRNYNKAINDYVSLVRKKKIKTRRSFAGDMGKNQWGRCFRWLKKGSSFNESPSALKKENGDNTRTVRETLRNTYPEQVKI